MKPRDSKAILIFPLRLAWRIFSRTATMLLLPVSGIVWVGRLLALGKIIRHSEVVVLMTNPSGYGGTIEGPDAARREFSGKRCLFLVSSWRFGFNPYVQQIWPDIQVVFVPRFVLAFSLSDKGKIVLPFLKLHDAMARWLTRHFVKIVGAGKILHLDLIDLCRMVAENKKITLLSPEGTSLWDESYAFEIGYRDLQKRKPAPEIHFPEIIREELSGKLEDLWLGSGRKNRPKLCCFYLRLENPNSRTAQLRNGTDVEAILPSVGLLNQSGYQVALIGDRPLTVEIKEKFNGGLVDHVTVGVNRNVYQLHVALEADIFIGNNGGGATVPLANVIPCLCIDWHPVISGFQNCWHYFKAAYYENGEAVPYRRLLGEHAHDIFCSFGNLENMTSEEIYDAVKFFIEDVKNMGAPDPHADIAALIPEDTVFRNSHARISPAWVRSRVSGLES